MKLVLDEFTGKIPKKNWKLMGKTEAPAIQPLGDNGYILTVSISENYTSWFNGESLEDTCNDGTTSRRCVVKDFER